MARTTHPERGDAQAACSKGSHSPPVPIYASSVRVLLDLKAFRRSGRRPDRDSTSQEDEMRVFEHYRKALVTAVRRRTRKKRAF